VVQTKEKFELVPPGIGQEKFGEEIMNFITDNMKIIGFFIIPFNAIVARYFLFRKSGLNFIEHMVAPFYVSGHMYWFTLFSALFYKVTGFMFFNSVILVISLFYFGFTYTQLITNQPQWKKFLKGMGVLIFGNFIMVASVLLALSCWAYLDPEVFELIRPSNNR
jgi:hypothetical protein